MFLCDEFAMDTSDGLPSLADEEYIAVERISFARWNME